MIGVKLLTYECHLLIIFASSLDPDQAGQNVRLDLDPNCLHSGGIVIFFY